MLGDRDVPGDRKLRRVGRIGMASVLFACMGATCGVCIATSVRGFPCFWCWCRVGRPDCQTPFLLCLSALRLGLFDDPCWDLPAWSVPHSLLGADQPMLCVLGFAVSVTLCSAQCFLGVPFDLVSTCLNIGSRHIYSQT